MENKFLEDLEKSGVKTPIINMMVNGDSYFDVYYSDIEEVNDNFNTKFKDFDEAIKIANDTIYGLGAGVWARSAHTSYRAGRAVEAGRAAQSLTRGISRPPVRRAASRPAWPRRRTAWR